MKNDAQRRTRSSWRRKLVFSIFVVGMFLAVVEIVLQGVLFGYPQYETYFVPMGSDVGSGYSRSPIDNKKAVTDPVLGLRPNPASPTHDKRGFRNPKGRNRTDILIFGDSQTYGDEVEATETWPGKLERMTGRTTYNISFGGWAPTHSLITWSTGASLRPSVVIEAFYAGNDLAEAYYMVYDRKHLSFLKTDSLEAKEAIRIADEKETLATKAGRQWDRYLKGVLTKQKTATSLTFQTAERIRLLGLCYRSAQRLRHGPGGGTWQMVDVVDVSDKNFFLRLRAHQIQTVLTPLYRLSVLDQTDPRLREGHQICLRAITQMKQRADEIGSPLMVVLIPTKELVFSELAEKALPSMPADYRKLIANEEDMWKRTRSFLAANDIPCIETLGSLRACLAEGRSPYFHTANGHPNPIGYEAIAKAVAQAFQEQTP